MGFDLYGQEPKNKFGEYFRQNVWGWRPIWEYVCTHHADSLDQKTLEMGNYNEGHIVSKQQATTLANKIHVDLQDGTVSDFVKMVEDSVKKAKEHNEKLEFHFELLKQEAIEISGNSNIAPVNYPNGLDGQWKFLMSLRDRKENYPTRIDDILAFQLFCKYSGGFSIC